MGKHVTVTTQFGEQRELYLRLNNIEASNHGIPSRARFRGYLSEDAFKNGGAFLWERIVEFDADVEAPLWTQAYDALNNALAAPDDEVM